MSMSSIPSSSPGGKRYGWVEKIGNKVPHPFLLFIYLIEMCIRDRPRSASIRFYQSSGRSSDVR